MPPELLPAFTFAKCWRPGICAGSLYGKRIL